MVHLIHSHESFSMHAPFACVCVAACVLQRVCCSVCVVACVLQRVCCSVCVAACVLQRVCYSVCVAVCDYGGLLRMSA